MYDELTPVDIQKMKEEIEYRVTVLRPKLIEDVKTAREWGDLSENFEYKAAKREKNRNDSRCQGAIQQVANGLYRAVELLSSGFAPVFQLFGIPPETAMLVLIRPISGSAALAVGADLMAQYGVDSQIGRTAAVMLGSTETTFYTISVYFGAAGIKKLRHTIPAALVADIAGFLAAAWCVKWLF